MMLSPCTPGMLIVFTTSYFIVSPLDFCVSSKTVIPYFRMARTMSSPLLQEVVFMVEFRNLHGEGFPLCDLFNGDGVSAVVLPPSHALLKEHPQACLFFFDPQIGKNGLDKA